MTELFIACLQAFGSVVLLLWLPGVLLCLMMAREQAWTLIDAYFAGWIWCILMGILIVPFTNETATVAQVYKLSSVALLLVFILFQLNNRKQLWPGAFQELFSRSISMGHIVITALVLVLTVLLVGTHNLGYDDVSNLDYLSKVIDGDVFPVYRPVVNDWEAIRYPLWGVIYGILSVGKPGVALFVYYGFGISIILVFLLKVYELILTRHASNQLAYAAVAASAAILMIGSYDNYFNYGIYPLQQAKLFYLLGVIYLIVGWWFGRAHFHLLLGLGLISGAAFYHMNLVILHAVVIGITITVIGFSKVVGKKRLAYSLLIIMPLVISAPAAFMPDNGFIREIKEEKISTGPKIKIIKPTYFEVLIKKAKKIFEWVIKGARKNFYIKRAFSLEVFLLPCLIALFLRYKALLKFSRIIIIGSFLVLVQQAIAKIPSQLLLSSLKSGTPWMYIDLLQSGIDFGGSTNEAILTDPYTGLYLKLLGKDENVISLEEIQQRKLFSPLLPLECREEVLSEIGIQENVRVILNGRHWGGRAISRWTKNKNQALDEFIALIRKSNRTDDHTMIPQIATSGWRNVHQKIGAPILHYFPEHLTTVPSHVCSHLVLEQKETDIRIYKDTALVVIKNVQQGDELIFDFEGVGDYVEIIGQLHSDEQNKDLIFTRPGKRKYGSVKVLARLDAEKAAIFFRIKSGHLNGLGRLSSVSIIQ